MPDKTEEKQRKYQKGKSGNPLGRPRGVRNKATLLAEKLLENEAEEICRQAIELAKKGNIQAIKIVLDRILPPKKEALIFIDLPVMKIGRYFRGRQSSGRRSLSWENIPFRRRNTHENHRQTS